MTFFLVYRSKSQLYYASSLFIEKSDDNKRFFEERMGHDQIFPIPFQSWGPFLKSPGNFSGPESYFMSARFTLKIRNLVGF